MQQISFSFYLIIALIAFSSCGGKDKGQDVDPTVVAEEISPEQKAVLDLTAAIDADPNNSTLYAQRGEVYYENRIYDRAAADLTKSIQLDSSRFEVWHMLADAQLDGLRSREALNTMIFAASRFPDRMGTLLKLSEFQFIVQRYDDALATLDRAAKLDINEGEVFFMIGQVYAEKGDTIRAINAYQRATELNPKILDAWLSLGILHEARGNKVAERYFNTAVAIDRENAVPYRMRADYFARQDRLNEAVVGYDEAIQRDPKLADAFYNSGLVLLDMDSIDRAAAQFERATAIRPAYVEAHYYRGVTAELQGKFEDARKFYQQALNMSPSFLEAQQAIDRLKSKPN